MLAMEVLLTTEEAEVSKTSVNFWNPVTGTKLLSLRGPTAGPQSLNLIKDEGVLIVEQGKPFIHFWQSGTSLQTSRRILCPGKPGPVAITSDGTYLAVAIEEKIYIWQVAAGRIVASITSAHYRPVNVLRFNSNDSFLISGGQDGMVLTWRLIALVSGYSVLPHNSWTDHAFPITDIHVGIGGRRATIFTVSSDRTAKIYSLNTGSLLLSVSFPTPLTSIKADAIESAFYVGATNGSIYQMKLYSPPRTLEHHITSDATADHVFKKHKEAITALDVSGDGLRLASADASGLLLIWDIESKQAMKTLAGIKSTVTNLQFWLGNPETLKGGRKAQVAFPEVPKLVEQDAGRDSDKVLRIWTRTDRSFPDDLPSKSTDSSTTDSNSMEMSKLRIELARCQQINSKLQEFCVNHILNESEPENVKVGANVNGDSENSVEDKAQTSSHNMDGTEEDDDIEAETNSKNKETRSKKRKKPIEKNKMLRKKTKGSFKNKPSLVLKK